jgi:hypothetical protein
MNEPGLLSTILCVLNTFATWPAAGLEGEEEEERPRYLKSSVCGFSSLLSSRSPILLVRGGQGID